MKFLFFCFLLVFSIKAMAGKCTIDFENEISANRETHKLFPMIKKNSTVLKKKGYQFMSAASGTSRFAGYIFFEDENKRRLEMNVYDVKSTREWSWSINVLRIQTSVRALLETLPNCNEFKLSI